jgi:hypothetical protein
VHGEEERSVDLDVRHAPPDEPVDGREVRRWWNRAKQLNQTGDVMAAENLLKVWPHLRENDRKMIKVAVDKCGSKYNLAPTTERELPLLPLERVIKAVRDLSMVCGYETTAVHATLKKLTRPL